MGSTYLDLTNKVLRAMGQTELTDTTFASARNIQAVCKDAVVHSINRINQQQWEWPFHSVNTTQTLVIGQNEYDWPSDFKSADWESFQIVPHLEVLNVRGKNLRKIDRDEWFRYFKPLDDNNAPLGIGVPNFVFHSTGYKYGVTPAPNKTYVLSFTYYKQEGTLTDYDDQTDIPSEYDNVIVHGALAYVNLFRENAQGVDIAEQNFKRGLKDMYNSLIGYFESLFDTRTNYAKVSLLNKSGNYKI